MIRTSSQGCLRKLRHKILQIKFKVSFDKKMIKGGVLISGVVLYCNTSFWDITRIVS